MDRRDLARLIGADFEKWKAIKAKFGRFPSRFLPYDATSEQIEAYRAAVDEAKKPARAQAAKERRARDKLEHKEPVKDLVLQRCAALVAFVRKHPGKHRTADLVRGLKRTKAFEGITDKTRRNVIDELLGLTVSGKLPMLSDHLIIATVPAKNRRPTFTVEARK